jgi:hypothetical protein
MTTSLYDRGYTDALAGREQDMHLLYHAQYRQGYRVGLLARQNRDEGLRRLIAEASVVELHGHPESLRV